MTASGDVRLRARGRWSPTKKSERPWPIDPTGPRSGAQGPGTDARAHQRESTPSAWRRPAPPPRQQRL